MNFGREDFCQRWKKKRSFASKPKKNIIPLVNKGIRECLHYMILLRVWRMFVLKVYYFQQFQSQMLILSQILLSISLVNFLKIFADLTIGLADAEDFFANLFDDMSKEKISKIELLTRGQTNNKLWYNCRKVVITAQSVLTKMNKILKPTGGCVDMWSLCQQHISGLFFTNLFLLTLYFKLIFHLFFYFQCHMFAIKKWTKGLD